MTLSPNQEKGTGAEAPSEELEWIENLRGGQKRLQPHNVAEHLSNKRGENDKKLLRSSNLHLFSRFLAQQELNRIAHAEPNFLM